MEYKELNRLIHLFWNGETTEFEEVLLKNYFLTTVDVPSEFKDIADYFKCTKAIFDQEPLDDFFDESIMKAIESKNNSTKPTLRRHILSYLRFAASVLVFAFASYTGYEYYILTTTEQTEMADTYDDPQKAFDEVKKALMMVSTNLNDGMEYTQEIKKFDEAKQIVTR